MAIDIRKSGTYNLLTNNGTKPAKHANGTIQVEADVLADQSNAICATLCGRGMNYYQIALILHVVQETFREDALSKKF